MPYRRIEMHNQVQFKKIQAAKHYARHCTTLTVLMQGTTTRPQARKAFLLLRYPWRRSPWPQAHLQDLEG
ncbi:hypothetical protein K443DRAFT_172925 [Laccaria amethystina LaAM-08-1]|uniref:Uncharacterized protein n=1 Tax=Laccaria amethystina LaAM-08-1 TaxID=1095629 RepID=A0A0C9WNX6_9AGAR|nr:hypothetical protein K443DRAFT_172925 [Laccaria amethystina LaAM-08-1]